MTIVGNKPDGHIDNVFFAAPNTQHQPTWMSISSCSKHFLCVRGKPFSSVIHVEVKVTLSLVFLSKHAAPIHPF